MDFLTKLCLTGAAVLFAAWLVLKNRGRIARAADKLSAISFRRVVLFLAFVAVAAIYGGTNAPPQGASPPMLMMDGGIAQFVPAVDAVRGYLLEFVTTNETYSYVMPSNAVRYSNWWHRGAHEDDSFASADIYDYENHGDHNSRPLRIGNREDAYVQIFSITESGASSVEKFGYRLSRPRWSFSGEVTKTQ